MEWELEAVGEFIVARLQPDTTLRTLLGATAQAPKVFPGSAPAGTPWPFVVYAFMAGRDWVAMGGGPRVLSSPLFLIKAVDRSTSPVTATRIARRIELNMMSSSGTVSDPPINIQKCLREEPVFSQEIDASNTSFWHAGGLYRMTVSRLG